MEAQPVTPGAALFSQAQVDALRRLKDAFEQKLLDEDEYKAEKAKVLNATPAAAPPAPADDDDDGFELVGVQTPAERAAESRRRAEAEGNVLEIDDDDDEFAAAPTIARGCDEFAAAPTIARAPAPPAGRFRAPERRRRVGPPAPRRIPRGEERVMLRCRRVYFGTALRRDVTVVFAPACVTMEWRSNQSGLYIETRIAPSQMTSFDLYHGPARGAGGDGEAHPINLADDDEMAPDAIREFVAIGLRQKPPHLNFIDGFKPTDRPLAGFEPTDDAGPRKYIVIVLEGDALATFKREAVPAVIWGGHLGWPAAPVLGTAVAARPFLEGVPIADALAAADAAEDAAELRRNRAAMPEARARQRRDITRSALSPAPAAAVELTAGADFVVPPIRQFYTRRAPDDIVPLTTVEKAAVLHAIAQLDGKATQKKVRRAAESAVGLPKGALDAKKAAVKEVCEDEMSKQAREELRAKRRKIDRPADTPQGLAACFAEFYPDSPAEAVAKFQQFVLDNTLCPRHVINMPVEKCESMLQQHGFEGVVVFTFQSRLREVCLG
jgi:hypothetical protein